MSFPTVTSGPDSKPRDNSIKPTTRFCRRLTTVADSLPVFPANVRRLTNVGSMSDQRLRRWPDIKPTLVQRLVFAGRIHITQTGI